MSRWGQCAACQAYHTCAKLVGGVPSDSIPHMPHHIHFASDGLGGGGGGGLGMVIKSMHGCGRLCPPEI